MYDDDLVGKDDHVGECTLSVPEGSVETVKGVLREGEK